MPQLPASRATGSDVPLLGDKAEILISCNQKLQELGIDNTIRLPRIVVVGDQSTGKSSLIEAISTIKVPQAAGLCTKCPIIINLSNAESPTAPWTCTVSIEEKYHYDSTRAKKTKVSADHPLGPWEPSNGSKVKQLSTVHNPDELLEAISHAQQLLLNPQRENDTFLPYLRADQMEIFSPNSIRLDVSKWGWTNLSFVDLPGTIASAGRGPEYLVDLVRNLAHQYARDKSNIILLTLPINHDVNNSNAYKVIQTEKAQTRTMAIFTKIDLARDEDRENYLHQYFGPESEEEFDHGHHMVMLESNGLPAGQAEIEYFERQPFANLPTEIQEKLGVDNLFLLLRQILFHKIDESLKPNLDSIDVRLQEVGKRLCAIPAPPNEVALPYELREQLLKFEGHISKLFTEPLTVSRTELMNTIKSFGTRLINDKPVLRVMTDEEVKELEDARNELQAADELQQVEIEDEDDDQEVNSRVTRGVKQPPRRIHRFQLQNIQTLNESYNASSMSGEIEQKAVEEMNKSSVQHWDKTLTEFTKKVRRVIFQCVLKCIDENFGHQKHLPLYKDVREIAEIYLDRIIQDEKQYLDRKCKAEKTVPFTLDMNTRKQHELEIRKMQRQKRKNARLEVANAQQAMENIGQKKKVKPQDESSLPPDEHDLEIQMFAKTAAYYEIASRRFADTICQDIQASLIPRCQKELVDHIKRLLGLNDIESNRARIAELMCEHPEREAERRRLLKEMDELHKGHEYIVMALGLAGNGNGDGHAEDDVVMEEHDVQGETQVKVPSIPSSSPAKRKANGVGPVQTPGVTESPSKRTNRSTSTISQLPRRGRSVYVEDGEDN